MRLISPSPSEQNSVWTDSAGIVFMEFQPIYEINESFIFGFLFFAEGIKDFAAWNAGTGKFIWMKLRKWKNPPRKW